MSEGVDRRVASNRRMNATWTLVLPDTVARVPLTPVQAFLSELDEAVRMNDLSPEDIQKLATETGLRAAIKEATYRKPEAAA